MLWGLHVGKCVWFLSIREEVTLGWAGQEPWGRAGLGPLTGSAISLLYGLGQPGPSVWHLQNGNDLSSRVVTEIKLTMYTIYGVAGSENMMHNKSSINGSHY